MKEGNTDKLIYKDLSYKIVGILFEVYNKLGYGYREKYYEKAIAEYLSKEKVKFKTQVPF
ncbi:MAG TPA: GxxExxY protein, partial [Patescibacteria group bacterium]